MRSQDTYEDPLTDTDEDDPTQSEHTKQDAMPTWQQSEVTVSPTEDKPRPWLPHVVLICCQCAFAVMHISSHPALEHIPPLPYSAVRVTLALPLLFAGARIKEPGYTPGVRDVPWLVTLGILGIGLPQSLVFVGNHLAGAAYAPILVPTTPVYVALLSAAFRMEPFNRYRGMGIVMSVTGALILVHAENLDLHKASTLGLLALWTVCFSYACYLVMLQHVLSTRPFPFTIFAYASLCGDICICTVAAPQFLQVDWANVPGSAWGALLWAGIVASAGAHSAIAWAISRCSAVLPATYGTIQPLLTATLAAIVLGQVLTPRDIASMALILAGLGVVIGDRYLRDKDSRRAVDSERGSYQAVASKMTMDNVELSEISIHTSEDRHQEAVQRVTSTAMFPGKTQLVLVGARSEQGSAEDRRALSTGTDVAHLTAGPTSSTGQTPSVRGSPGGEHAQV